MIWINSPKTELKSDSSVCDWGKMSFVLLWVFSPRTCFGVQELTNMCAVV